MPAYVAPRSRRSICSARATWIRCSRSVKGRPVEPTRATVPDVVADGATGGGGNPGTAAGGRADGWCVTEWVSPRSSAAVVSSPRARRARSTASTKSRNSSTSGADDAAGTKGTEEDAEATAGEQEEEEEATAEPATDVDVDVDEDEDETPTVEVVFPSVGSRQPSQSTTRDRASWGGMPAAS